MSLIKRGKYYWLDIRIKRKRIRRSLHTAHKTIALARYGEKKEELESELGGKKIRFSDFCDKYLEWAWSSKPLSAKREQQRLRKIQEFFQGMEIVYLDDITPYHIEQLKAKLLENGLTQYEPKKGGVSKTTVNLYLQTLRGLFYKAIDWEVYHEPNPVKKVRFFKREGGITPLSAEDLTKVLESVRKISEKPRSRLQALFYDLVIFGLNTGMRRAEVLNLTFKSVKEDTATVKGKGGKVRSIPLNKTAMEIIQKQPRKSGYVFDLENKHLPTLFTKTTDRIKRETGVNFHYHLLRHNFASSLLEKGVDILTIAELLGHSKFTMSLIYSHTDDKRKKRAVRLLE